jgi:uncharacterized protein YecE (DUF72 family)
MDFGKLPSVEGFDFRLPPEPPQNAEVLEKLRPRRGPGKVYIGVTGYNQKEWLGKWYPGGVREGQFLRHYGAQFNTIEHNTTHYRIPDAPTVERWRTEVPEDFRYCPKIPQAISHARALGLYDPALIAQFANAIRPLGPNLGCCFLQLPPYFALDQLGLLESFLRVFPRDLPLAVEARHESFFTGGPDSDAYFQLLHGYNVTAVITDVAGRRDVLHLRLTNGRTMIRFVGNGLHPSDFSRVEQWADRLGPWLRQGLREVYFFCHEPGNILAPDLAAFVSDYFAASLPEVALRGPKPLPGAGLQATLF